MAIKKNKNVFIVLASVLLLGLCAIGLLVGTHRTTVVSKTSPPKSAHQSDGQASNSATEVNNQQANLQSTAAKDLLAQAKAQDEKILRFSSDAAKANFLAQNNLSVSSLTAIPQLNAYTLKASTVHTVGGTTVYNNQVYRAALTPLDPDYSAQWHLNKIGAPTAWNNTTGSSAITVAIIDTGVALTHQDLANQWAVNSGESGATASEGAAPNCTSRGLSLDKSCNNLDDDGDGYIDNNLGWNFTNDTNNVQAGLASPLATAATHGTLVSGLVDAEANNNLGVSGVAWGAKLLPVQALGDDGVGDTVSVASAVHYAVDHGAEVINMSLGSDTSDPLLQEQVQYALTAGVSVVAAAGNDGCNCMIYPANYTGVIGVGASTATDTRASFSSYGSNLSLVAPGTDSICSTAWSSDQPTDLYSCAYSGTSFASPIVAGSAVLLLSQNPNLTPAQVRSALTSTATKVSGMGGQNFTTTYGYGLLNVYEALKSVSLPTPRGHCTSHFSAAECVVRAINTQTNQVIDFGTVGLSAGGALYDSALQSLGSGTWLLQDRAVLNGQMSLAEENVSITKP